MSIKDLRLQMGSVGTFLSFLRRVPIFFDEIRILNGGNEPLKFKLLRIFEKWGAIDKVVFQLFIGLFMCFHDI